MEQLAEFAGNHALLSTIFVGLLLALIFTELHRRTRGFRGITPQQATQLINRSDAAVIDVSSSADYQAAHILNARHLPLSQLDPGRQSDG